MTDPVTAYANLIQALHIMKDREIDDGFSLDANEADRAIAFAHMLKDLQIDTPKIFTSGSDTIVFKWHYADPLFVTFDEDDTINLFTLGAAASRDEVTVPLSDKELIVSIISRYRDAGPASSGAGFG